MYHLEEYPFQHEQLPDVKQLLQTVDWDILCVFGGCRWDAFEGVCSESEPVNSPGDDTPTWVTDVWCDAAIDWSNMTYLNTNQMMDLMMDLPQYGDAVIDEHVKTYIPVEKVIDDQTEVQQPEALTNIFTNFSTPLVLHFNQPHFPYVGNNDVTFRGRDYGDVIETDFEEINTVFELAETGHISPDLVRAFYIDNLKLVWEASASVRNSDNRVVTTGDSGEILGPDSWGSGDADADADQARVVPFHTNWDVDLPDPTSVGADATYSWHHSSSESETTISGDMSRTEFLQNKLEELDK